MISKSDNSYELIRGIQSRAEAGTRVQKCFPNAVRYRNQWTMDGIYVAEIWYSMLTGTWHVLLMKRNTAEGGDKPA